MNYIMHFKLSLMLRLPYGQPLKGLHTPRSYEMLRELVCRRDFMIGLEFSLIG